MNHEPADYFPCGACGKPTHIDDLDGKPDPRINGFWHGVYRRLWLWWTGHSHAAFDDPEGSTDWNRLECGECYGPGYVSNNRDSERSADGNSYRYHATGLPAGGDA